MAKQERAVRTRQAVLVAAAEVIGERGYEAATIAEIIQRAQVTKGALYFHFPSKDALARAVIAEQTEMLVPPPSDSRVQDAIDFSHRVARALRTDPVLQAGTRIAVETTFSSEPLVPYQDWINIATGMFAEARDRGELLPAVNPAKAAEFLFPPTWAYSSSRWPPATATTCTSGSSSCGGTSCRGWRRPAR